MAIANEGGASSLNVLVDEVKLENGEFVTLLESEDGQWWYVDRWNAECEHQDGDRYDNERDARAAFEKWRMK